MTYVRPRPVLAILTVYLVGGLAIALAVPALKSLAAAQFGRAGIAIAFVVNVAMPLLAIVLAAIYPRLWVALIGTGIATLAFLAVFGLVPLPVQQTWFTDMLARLGPILTVACVGYQILAGGTVAILRPFRRVGVRPDPAACRHCGYLLIGLVSDKCPECGNPRSDTTAKTT